MAEKQTDPNARRKVPWDCEAALGNAAPAPEARDASQPHFVVLREAGYQIKGNKEIVISPQKKQLPMLQTAAIIAAIAASVGMIISAISLFLFCVLRIHENGLRQ